MRRFASTPIAALMLLLLLSGCAQCHRPTVTGDGDHGGQKKVALVPPKGTPKQPVGMTALTVRSGPEPFTKQDVSNYFQTNNLPRNSTASTDFRVDTIEFITSNDVTARLEGVSTGLPASARVGFVTLSGTFVFTGPVEARSPTFSRAYAVFDAASGNLLMVGSPERRQGAASERMISM
jgi:outer membrane protein assembly factor BamE (lipoprotein component of BamABCDE complex)